MPSKPRLRSRIEAQGASPQGRKAVDVMLNLALAAITMLFVGLTFAYTFGRKLSDTWDTFSLPKGFWASTALLLASSYALQKAREAFNNDDAKVLRRMLGLTALGGLAFMVAQVLSWRQLAASGVAISGSPSGGYLYVISWLHAAHVLVGLVFLGLVWRKAVQGTKDVVSGLMYFSDESAKHRLQLMSTYWHVVDGLWVYLFLFFLFFHS
jgi:cytochrome c oxidase subunit 3